MLMGISKVAQQILDLFPLEDIIRKDSPGEATSGPTSHRLQSMGESLVWQQPIPPEDGEEDLEIHRAGNFYKYYRSVECLPENARLFYDKAGKLTYHLVLVILGKLTCLTAEITGLSLEMLVRAVYLVERRLQVWAATEKRRELSQQYDLDDEINNDD